MYILRIALQPQSISSRFSPRYPHSRTETITPIFIRTTFTHVHTYGAKCQQFDRSFTHYSRVKNFALNFVQLSPRDIHVVALALSSARLLNNSCNTKIARDRFTSWYDNALSSLSQSTPPSTKKHCSLEAGCRDNSSNDRSIIIPLLFTCTKMISQMLIEQIREARGKCEK